MYHPAPLVFELDSVVVKGRKAPMRVFEGETDPEMHAQKLGQAETYQRALTAFRQGRGHTQRG